MILDLRIESRQRVGNIFVEDMGRRSAPQEIIDGLAVGLSSMNAKVAAFRRLRRPLTR